MEKIWKIILAVVLSSTILSIFIFGIFNKVSLKNLYIAHVGFFPTEAQRALDAQACKIVSNPSDYTDGIFQNYKLKKCLLGQFASVLGGLVTKPNTFSPGSVIRSADVNSNFDTLYSLVNGSISNSNLSASAAIDNTKISGTAIVSTGQATQTISSVTTTFEGTVIVSSTTGFFRVPLMTTAQKTSLGSVSNGSIVYDTTLGEFSIREGGAWAAISPAAATAVASQSGKGIVELATGAEAAATAASGSGDTNAPLVLSTLISTSTGGLSGNWVPISNSSGKLAASWGGSALTLATLNSSALVVENPASATTTPTLNSIPLTTGSTTDLNRWVQGYETQYTAGEAIDASSIPQAVYLSALDGKVYKASVNFTSTTFQFIGFVAKGQNVTTNNSVWVTQGDGAIINGFSGFTTGTALFISVTGTVTGTIPSVIDYKVARAVSNSSLVIEKGNKYYSGNLTITSSGTSTIQTGFRIGSLNVYAISANAGTSAFFSNGGWAEGTGAYSVYKGYNGVSNIAGISGLWFLQDGAGTTHTGSIANITNNSFDLVNVKAGSAANIYVFYQAIGY